jgi:steroid delta-isomerase-like uncharacterized protein
MSPRPPARRHTLTASAAALAAALALTALSTPGVAASTTPTAAGGAAVAGPSTANTAAPAATGAGAERRRLERNKALALRFYPPFETGDASTLVDVLADGWVDVPLSPGQGPGRDGFGPVIAYFHNAFPDLELTIEEVTAEGDRVVVRTTATGTHLGEFLGVPATGRTITFRTSDTHLVRGNRIVQTWHLEDLFGAYQQMTAPGTDT